MSQAPGRTSVSPTPRKRALWYAKFVFAIYAAAIASSLILFALVAVVGGTELAGQWFAQSIRDVRLFGILVLVLGFAWAPFIWRRLR
jgi:hypothetical protein